jgi:hippurate hydrolase
MPQASVDPVVMAAAIVLRLQTIVSREIAAADAAVVTVGMLQAGTKENVIPDEAIIKLNVRTFVAGVRKRVLAAIERIAKAEAAASGAPRPPEITTIDRYPLNVNNQDATKRWWTLFANISERDASGQQDLPPRARISDRSDPNGTCPRSFGSLAAPIRRRTRRKEANRINELPVNHSPKFAPVLHPTLQTGVEALVVVARAWLPT